jgi:hypothetical protein
MSFTNVSRWARALLVLGLVGCGGDDANAPADPTDAAGSPGDGADAGGDQLDVPTNAHIPEAGADVPPAEMTLPDPARCDRWAAPTGTAASCTADAPCSVSTCLAQLGANAQVCCLKAGVYTVPSVLRPSASGTPDRPLVLRADPAAPRPATKPSTNTPCMLNAGRVTLALASVGSVVNFGGADGSARNWWVFEGIDVDLASRTGGSGIVFPHTSTGLLIKNSVVRDGKHNNAIYVAGDDAQILGNCVFNNFKDDNSDAHAIAVTGVFGEGSANRVKVAGNWLYDVGGDSVQCNDGSNVDYGLCTAGTSGCTNNPAGPPKDVWLLDNHMFSTPAEALRMEEAVDVKSCADLTIGSEASPRSNLPDGVVAQNKFSGFRGKNSSPGGAAIVVHYNAKRVLIERTRIWDSGEGIVIGRTAEPFSAIAVDDTVIRNNLFFDLCGDISCRGRAIRINKARRMDIYDNTIDNVPGAAIRIGIDNPSNERLVGINVWSNIVRSDGNWLEVSRDKLDDFEAAYNLFWAQGGATTDTVRFRVDGCPGTVGGLTWFQGCEDGDFLFTDDRDMAP